MIEELKNIAVGLGVISIGTIMIVSALIYIPKIVAILTVGFILLVFAWITGYLIRRDILK